MRFNVIINQERCLKLGVNLSEAALLSLFNELSSWADTVVVEGEVYYHLSRNKVIEELPFFFHKPDTVYRCFKNLSDLNLIDFTKRKKRDLVRLTTLGKTFNKLGNKSEKVPNSEMNPSKFGNESEKRVDVNGIDVQCFTGKNSDSFPTYNNNYTSDNFLRNWNEMRISVFGTKSNLNKLYTEEQEYFVDLAKNYTKEEWHKALNGLFKQEEMPKEIMRFRPKHFLKNFDQYLDAENNKKYNLYV